MVSKKKGHTNVVALDNDDDDWDNVQVNQAEKTNPGHLTFYNRGPWVGAGNNEQKKAETMGGVKAGNKAVAQPSRPKQGGFMVENTNEIDDWDSPSPQKAR